MERSMNTVKCPECAADINIDASTELGEILVCPDCGLDLEIISLDPPLAEPAPIEQEDWGE
jgi:alpha-aminoadipate carrier protein LysW